MERAREDGKENWSDCEAQLADKLNTIESRDMDNVTKLNQDLHEIRFAKFQEAEKGVEKGVKTSQENIFYLSSVDI